MKQRIITGTVIAAVLVGVFLLSEYVVYPIVLALLAFGGVFEMLRVIGQHTRWILSIPAYLIALALPVASFYLMKSYDDTVAVLVLALALFLYLLYSFLVAVFAKGKILYADLSEVFVSVTYVVTCFTALTILRYLPMGFYYFGLVFIAAWISDVFAYFTGVFFGKHKLIPEISPKKTVEGSLGGIVFAAVFMVLYGWILSLAAEVTPNYLVLSIGGILLAVVGQIGDLLASLVKREHGVKDYGRLMPGHGGIMDRFDSVLAVSAATMILCLLFPPFT